MSVQNIADLFFPFAETQPERPALLWHGQTVTYAALAGRVSRRIKFYRRYGLRPGDKVLVFVPMSPALYEILIALFAMNVTAVFLDAWADGRRMDLALQAAECRAFIGIPKAFFLLLRSRELRRVPLKFFARSTASSGTGNVSRAETSPDDPALLTFTTGSTGIPKAACRTHGFLMAQHEVLTRSLALPPDTVDMATLPIFALNNLACGFTTLIPDFDMRHPGTVDGVSILREAETCGVTSCAASPAFFLPLVNAALLRHAPACPSLRKCFSGGAAVYPAFASRFLQAFPHCDAFAVYGSTEAEPIAEVSFADLARVSGTEDGIPAGTPIPEIELALLKPDAEPRGVLAEQQWADMQAPPGEPGEICVAGPHVLKTYYRNPEAVRENKFQVAHRTFHRTGDLGRIDSNGKLFLLGRRKASFRDSSGHWRFPMREEAVLAQIDGVSAGTILALPDNRTLLVWEGPGSPDDVRDAILRAGLAFDELRNVPEIPRDPRHNSKIDYEALRAILGE